MAEREQDIFPSIDIERPDTPDERVETIYQMEDPVSAEEAYEKAILLGEYMDAGTFGFNIIDSDHNSRGIKVYFIGDKWQSDEDQMKDTGVAAPPKVH